MIVFRHSLENIIEPRDFSCLRKTPERDDFVLIQFEVCNNIKENRFVLETFSFTKMKKN